MLNFIVCEDDKVVLKKIVNLITKIMMPFDFEYVINEFNDYRCDINKLAAQSSKKIYILDIELPSKSGLDIARCIREKDWESIIIIVTAHSELGLDAVRNRLMLLDFISKFDNFESRLKLTLEIAVQILENKKTLVFESRSIKYRLKFDDIIYIIKDTLERKSIIKTTYMEYRINENISSIKKRLDNRFFQSHRSCIVNTDYIKKIDFKEGKITFSNNEYLYLLARDKKKGLRERVKVN